MASTFFRGSTVFFDVVFKDEDGAVVNPSGAVLVLSFSQGPGQPRGDETLTLAAGEGTDGGWGVTDGWDSRVAKFGTVYAHARTTDDPPISSVDFEFKLTANAANDAANA